MINIYLKKYNPLQENAVVEFFKKTASFANSQIQIFVSNDSQFR